MHTYRCKCWLAVLLAFLLPLSVWSGSGPEFSTAGFYVLPQTGRSVYSMNPDWRFYKGSFAGAEQPDLDDSGWSLVSLPDGLELLPVEASGCINYQGEAWYRKHFTPDEAWRGQRLFLHFEGIMGKSKVWVNGHLVEEHYGGFLPAIADVTDYVEYGRRFEKLLKECGWQVEISPGVF